VLILERISTVEQNRAGSQDLILVHICTIWSFETSTRTSASPQMVVQHGYSGLSASCRDKAVRPVMSVAVHMLTGDVMELQVTFLGILWPCKMLVHD